MQRRDSAVSAGPLMQKDAGTRASFLGALGALVTNLPGLFSDRVDLLSLELQRAGLALVHLLIWGVAAAMLLLTAWLGLWVVLAAVAVQGGLPWPGVVLGVVAINLLAAWGAISVARRMAPRLGLPMTRRHLDFGRGSPRPDAEQTEHDEQQLR